jgi:SAM-dependent methyltransferase
MNFYRSRELTPHVHDFLAQYDQTIRALVGKSISSPIRMRDWELYRVIEATAGLPKNAKILDTGSFNTYLGLYLSQTFPDVTVSDLLGMRLVKSLLRRIGLAPKKATEADYSTWCRLMKEHGLKVRSVDLTRIPYPDNTFDCIVSLSVIEHVPATELALSELYRVLAPGGRLLVTTDCSQEAKPYAENVRYFTKGEMEVLFGPYPVTSMRNEPDFARENWCYGGKQAVVTSFVQITKPR